MSPVQLLLRPSPWVDVFFVVCCLVFSRFLPPWPKNAPKPMGKQKKKHKVSPHVTCPASPQTLSMGRNLFFFFGGGFSKFLQLSVQQYQLPIFFVFFVFLFLGLLGEIFTLTNIHWHSFHPSTFHIDVFIELLILATEPPEKMYSKNSSITHLFRHSIGLMFYWYAQVLVPHV